MSLKLDYASPLTPSIPYTRIRGLRVMAALFAMLAASSPVLAYSYFRLTSVRVPMFALFAPGFPIAIGLIWRAFGHPSLTWRRLAWASFLIIAGAWELVLFSNHFHGRPPRGDLHLLVCWVIASVLSVLWLILEPPLPRSMHILRN